MKRLAIAALLLVAGFEHARAIETGNDLQEACQIVDSMGIRAKTTSEDVFKAGACVGFITAILRTRELLDKTARFCVPTGVNATQAVKVLLKYLSDHPAMTHNKAEAMAILAFMDAWPCQ